ncbi:MAG: hypothetical protein EZS28_027245 [Streblomastix strix]|uniref:Uncharacterized protein n=1 Tax=Streblomastix strix TaxID=222440 RepID=A0A5J4V3B0_9EUKA|nr:MAG: hypothetical protein EZS28_027245 [Streblomastix strix]
MSQRDTPTPTLISRDGPDKEPRDRDSVVNKELRGNQSQFPETLIQPSQGSQFQSSCLAIDSYTRIDDDFMENKGCEVYVNEQTGEIQVRFRGIPKAIVKEQGLFSIQTNVRQDYQFWDFESDEEMKLWVACIQADAALMKNERLQNVIRASQGKTRTFRDIDTDLPVPSGGLQMHPVKRKREQDGIQEIRVLNPLQAQFQAQRQKIFEVQLYTGLTDCVRPNVNPIPRQKLFEEISWKGANTIFPMPEAPPALPEEGPAYARMTLESISAVTQGIAGTIHEISQGNTENLVGKMFKLLEASLVAVGDAQQERESRLRGVSQGITTEDVLSKHSKEKFKKSGKHIQISQRRFGNQVEQSSGFRRGRIRSNKRKFQYKPRGAFMKEFNFKRQDKTRSNDLDDKYNP